MILFLDFDGVLHPVRQKRETQDMHLRRLFCCEEALSRVLDPYPDLRIILSTDWRYDYSLPYLVGLLPFLGPRVIGTTTRRPVSFSNRRYEFIAKVVARDEIKDWLALDDDVMGWPERESHRLVACDSYLALGEPGKLQEVADRLRDLQASIATGGSA